MNNTTISLSIAFLYVLPILVLGGIAILDKEPWSRQRALITFTPGLNLVAALAAAAATALTFTVIAIVVTYIWLAEMRRKPTNEVKE